MNERIATPQRLGGMIGISFVLHLVFFFIFVTYGAIQNFKIEPQVCYVDIMDLPTANPLEGHGSPKGPAAMPAPPVPAPQAAPATTAPPVKTAPMALPAARAKTAPAPADEGKAFQERLAKIQQNQDARHEEDALAAIRARLAAGGKGERGAKGSPTGSGSDYASYIQSRLRDAFAVTITYQSRDPKALVLLNIDAAGRLTGFRIVKSSGDKLFDDAVSRAIAIAAKNFPRTPDGKDFSRQVQFRPEGRGGVTAQ